jgi:hypothetical protein
MHAYLDLNQSNASKRSGTGLLQVCQRQPVCAVRPRIIHRGLLSRISACTIDTFFLLMSPLQDTYAAADFV